MATCARKVYLARMLGSPRLRLCCPAEDVEMKGDREHRNGRACADPEVRARGGHLQHQAYAEGQATLPLPLSNHALSARRCTMGAGLS